MGYNDKCATWSSTQQSNTTEFCRQRVASSQSGVVRHVEALSRQFFCRTNLAASLPGGGPLSLQHCPAGLYKSRRGGFVMRGTHDWFRVSLPRA